MARNPSSSAWKTRGTASPSAVTAPARLASRAAPAIPSREVRSGWKACRTSVWETRYRVSPGFSYSTRSQWTNGSRVPPNRLFIRRAPRATPRILPCFNVKKVTIRSASPHLRLFNTIAGVLSRGIYVTSLLQVGEEGGRETEVDRDSRNVVGRGHERAGGDGRVHAVAFQEDRHDRSHGRRHDQGAHHGHAHDQPQMQIDVHGS